MTKFPTDEQLDELEKEMWVSTGVVEWGQRESIFNHREFVREALNRWGTPEPIALEDREPHHTDLDECGSCWWWDEVKECYESLCGDMGGIHSIREVNKMKDYPHHYTHCCRTGQSNYQRRKKMTDYKQLSQELYDALKRVRCFSISNSEIDNLIQKYEDETARGTGRTTALYMKAIAEALANPGDRVEFQDHYPLTWNTINSHSDNLKNIISKLGYDIVVTVIADTSNKGNKIILTNRFKK